MKLLLAFLALASITLPQTAFALSKNALAITCLESVRYFSLSAIAYDPRISAVENGPGLFLNETEWDENQGPLVVSRCNIGNEGEEIVVERTYLNIPRASGRCGGGDWATFDVFYDDLLVAKVHSGCLGNMRLEATAFELEVCIQTDFSGLSVDCRGIHWGNGVERGLIPLETSVFGGWKECLGCTER